MAADRLGLPVLVDSKAALVSKVTGNELPQNAQITQQPEIVYV